MVTIIIALLGSPWVEVLAEGWKLGHKLWRGLADEGMYEVLDYQVKLEIKDKQGKRALCTKRERVRYLQNNIIAYQDQAWGDGDFLVNYRCTPGKEVDRYQVGYKTLILISLQETKQKGDVDEFIIEREVHNGLLQTNEYYEVEIGHRTRHLLIQIVFPKGRPPRHPVLVERLRQQRQPLSAAHVTQLPNGRWLLWWETNKPRLHEHYLLRWTW